MPPPLVDVVAAVIERNGRWLLACRAANKRHGGLWEFPGGKVGPGESLNEALARELREELDLELGQAGAVLYSVADEHAGVLVHFIAATVYGEPVLLEHQACRWVARQEFECVTLAPADQRFVTAALSSCRSIAAEIPYSEQPITKAGCT